MTLAVKHNKSLSVLASFGVGGVAEHFVRIRGEALPEALAWAEEQALPFRVIGSATNIVFPNYLPGLLIQLDGGEVRNGGQNELVADAGVPLQALVDANDQKWKVKIPGRPIFNRFAAAANIEPGRLKLLYLTEAAKQDFAAFGDVLDLFRRFAEQSAA